MYMCGSIAVKQIDLAGRSGVAQRLGACRSQSYLGASCALQCRADEHRCRPHRRTYSTRDRIISSRAVGAGLQHWAAATVLSPVPAAPSARSLMATGSKQRRLCLATIA